MRSPNPLATRWRTFRTWLNAPEDIAGLAVYRVAFGLMMAFSAARFMAQGWIERVFVEPTFFFRYPGFEWVQTWAPLGLYLHFSLLVALALCVALGVLYRLTLALFILGFAYVQLLDVTNYLNHYYLVGLLAGLMLLMPLNGAVSVDARLWPQLGRTTVPRWMRLLLRFQVAVVYFYAALAKFGADWLLYAQPMNLWLVARTETPVLGRLFAELWVAYAMSWFGFLYDLTIPLFLSLRRSRTLAYVAVVVFHLMTWVLFDIGMFPIIMIVSATLFFEPSWPRRFLPIGSGGPNRGAPLNAFYTGALCAYCLVQLALPARHFFYDGDVLWNERGMRYAWKVMVREKNGSVTYRVRSGDREWQVSPREYLDLRQSTEMSGQPDLIVQLGKHIAGEFERKGVSPVAVYVDTRVSLNGRRAQPLIDPDFNILNANGRDHSWLLPAPTEPPPQLRGIIE